MGIIGRLKMKKQETVYVKRSEYKASAPIRIMQITCGQHRWPGQWERLHLAQRQLCFLRVPVLSLLGTGGGCRGYAEASLQGEEGVQCWEVVMG